MSNNKKQIWFQWILATSLGELLGFAVPAVIGPVANFIAQEYFGSFPQVFVIIIALFGIFFLLSIGFAQWIILKRYIKKAYIWIPANGIAWPIGVAVPIITISLVPNRSPVFAFIVAGVIGGCLMGVVAGAITGYALVKLIAVINNDFKKSEISTSKGV